MKGPIRKEPSSPVSAVGQPEHDNVSTLTPAAGAPSASTTRPSTKAAGISSNSTRFARSSRIWTSSRTSGMCPSALASTVCGPGRSPPARNAPPRPDSQLGAANGGTSKPSSSAAAILIVAPGSAPPSSDCTVPASSRPGDSRSSTLRPDERETCTARGARPLLTASSVARSPAGSGTSNAPPSISNHSAAAGSSPNTPSQTT